jgi:hypothetical protein
MRPGSGVIGGVVGGFGGELLTDKVDSQID